MTNKTISVYASWDINTRVFHWVNVVCIFMLSILGLIMLNKGSIGISGAEASIGLKTIHTIIGYVFAINLIVRIIWGFVGGPRARFSTLLPGKGYRQEVKNYTASIKAGEPRTFIGHNPKGRLSVLVMFLLFTVMMVTGMVRTGTDIYYPPFGGFAAKYVAAEGVSFKDIKPYDNTGTDAEKMDRLKTFKKPYGTIHIYTAYILWVLVLIHIIAVIRADAGGQGTLISAMFSGKKHLPREPYDL